MTEPEIKRIVAAVIQNDIAPPSTEYSNYDYGVSLARTLTSEDAAILIASSLESLPSSLAATFLEGVLDCVNGQQLENVLFASLSHSREVSSAGPIVDWLLARCGLALGTIAMHILRTIRNMTDSHAQNTHAYALWVLCDSKITFSENRKAGEPVNEQAIQEMLDDSLFDFNKTQYLKNIISDCKASWFD